MLLLCCVVQLSVALACRQEAVSQPVRLSLTSHRNSTGHWIGKVTLDHGAGVKDAGHWEVDLEHSTVKCGEQDSVMLVATLTAPPPSRRRPVDPGYRLFPGLGHYKLHTATPVWSTARETCATEGAHLLILNSEAEFAAVKQLWDQHPAITGGWQNEFLHLGITDFVADRRFVTLFGDPVNATGYVKWGPNEPDSGSAANCGAVKRNGDLYDSNCTNQLAFVCEIEL